MIGKIFTLTRFEPKEKDNNPSGSPRFCMNKKLVFCT